jgi:hypothetical protein
MKDLPPPALKFAMALGKEYGMCGEVMLTAYAVYAQIVEDLSCDDPAYQVTPHLKDMFSRSESDNK